MPDTQSSENPMLANPVVYQLPYAGEVRRGISYGSGPGILDLYLPEQLQQPAPVAVLVTGYPDPGFEEKTGRKIMQLQANVDWARLLAASGIAAVIYSNVEPNADAFSVLAFLRSEAAVLQIDPERIGIWSCSGNVPNAINLLHADSRLRCAVLLYGYMLDSSDTSAVADAAATFGFVNPNRGMENFPENTPILIIKAGKDELPGLNQSIDLFEAEAISRNSPVSAINFVEGIHAFDSFDDSRRSVEMIKLCLQFMRLRLRLY